MVSPLEQSRFASDGHDKMGIQVCFLIGSTASGKSDVALELARRTGAEIISIDSMKIYRRMDIGTAKPSAEIRREVAHHLIDIVEPSESYCLGQFVEDADRAIQSIHSRGRPIIAEGGSMMFVRGLLCGVFEGPPADPAFRFKLRERAGREGTASLHAELAKVDPEAADRIHPNDLRRIERALEVYRLRGQPISRMQTQWERPRSDYDCRVVALRHPTEITNRRINARVGKMINAGLVKEVRSLIAEPAGLGEQAAQAVGYAEIIRYLRGEWTLEEAVEHIKINTRHLGKSQRTWMRRMPGVQWLDLDGSETVEQIADRIMRRWMIQK